MINIEWTTNEELLCIQDDGTVSVYDIFGIFLHSFQMGQEAKETKIIEASTFSSPSGTGLVVLTTNFRFFVVNNIKDPRIRRFPDIPGYVWMGSLDFRRKYCEHDTQSLTVHKQLAWCGSEAVVLNFGSILLVLSQSKDNFTLVLDSLGHVIPEVDGLRIITNTSHEFLQKVPLPNQEIFRIGSMAPGAILVEASREFQKRSHRAEEYIRLVKGQLETAVTQCIDAAGYEWQPSVQKLLLRAAQLGKSFLLNQLDAEVFVTMCQTLRILNAIRHYKMALPLTFGQLEQLTRAGLLDRLILRRQYSLAIQICRHLNIPDVDGINRIMTHWACYKIKHGHMDTEQLANEISAKLGVSSKVSYSSIALKAIECKQEKLAIRLLDFEHRASEQIPLLLRLGQEPQALTKAVESGNPNLIYHVLIALKEKHSSDEFYMTIRAYPAVNALYAKLCRTMQMGSLEQIYEQEDNFNGQAMLSVRESYKVEGLENRLALLSTATKQFRQAKSSEIWATLTEDQSRLLKAQSGYAQKLACPAKSVVDVSLNDTMKLLIEKRDWKEFDELAKKFKVPERRIWWLKVNTLAQMCDWIELEKLSRLKKSPIGYEPFVDACLQHGNNEEAKRYLAKVDDNLQVKYYVKAKCYSEAAQIAFQRKDTEALHYIQSQCASQRDTVDNINSLIAKLASPVQQSARR
nr:EOG090X01BU [Sida crystallina]